MVRSSHPINAPTYLRLRDQIRTDIEAGCWRLGQHLTLHELSVHYRVSNVPVREALLQLQGDGLVDMRMNRGAVVLEVDEPFIDEYFDLRGALQPMLVARLCQRAPGEILDGLSRAEELLVEVEVSLRAGRVRALLAADQALQDLLSRKGGNAPAAAMLTSRSLLLDAFRRGRPDLPSPALAEIARQDRALMIAISRGDVAAGHEAVRRHVAAARSYMKGLLPLPDTRDASSASIDPAGA